MDYGCMNASPHKFLFYELTLVDEGEVSLKWSHHLQIKGIGIVPIKMFDGVTRYLQNVRWVPFKKNCYMNLLLMTLDVKLIPVMDLER